MFLKKKRKKKKQYVSFRFFKNLYDSQDITNHAAVARIKFINSLFGSLEREESR